MEEADNTDTEMSLNNTAPNASDSIAGNGNVPDNKIQSQKTKRGRKVALTTKENDSQMSILVECSTSIVDNLQLAPNSKKKRGRKSQTNQRNESSNWKDEVRNVTTASTSDEDEECSALNCIRPAGKISNCFVFFKAYRK